MSSKKPKISIKEVPLTALRPDRKNARHHSEESNDALTASMGAFGAARSIVVDKSGVVRAGNGALAAAKQNGVDRAIIVESDGSQLVVVKRSDWSDEQALAYALADNRVQELSYFDPAALESALQQLKKISDKTGDTTAIEATGFSEKELNALLERGKMPAIPVADLGSNKGNLDDDDVPEPPKKPVTKLGDIWKLGQHIVVCGDSTDASVVASCLPKRGAKLMVTDPPYGVEYDPKWRAAAGVNRNKKKLGAVQNDDRADWREAWALFDGDVAYVYHAGLHAGVVGESLEASGFLLRAQIVWAKDRMALSRGDYHWQHEPCWYAVRKGARGLRTGDRSQTTLWNIPARDDSGHGHGTQKPVECMARPIRNHVCDAYDPFLGSGTTLIAAEQLGRRCYGVELSPAYCDVVVERWETLTGGKAQRAKRAGGQKRARK